MAACGAHHRGRPGPARPGCQRRVGAGGRRRRRGGLPAGAHRRRVWTSADAFRQISFRFAADDDQFMTIAKMRAARQLWARVAEVLGVPDAGAATVHAVTSLPMMAQRDPWVNMLRSTLAAFGAGVGGADTVLVHPFDVAIPGGAPGSRTEFRPPDRPQHPAAAARGIPPRAGCWIPRAARGSSRISPRSWPQQAWQHFQDIEAQGGFAAAARLHRRADRGGGTRRLARHRAPQDRRHRGQRIPEPRRSAAAAG